MTSNTSLFPSPFGENALGTNILPQGITIVSTVTVTHLVVKQPFESVTVTQYAVVTVGVANGEGQLVQLNAKGGTQE